LNPPTLLAQIITPIVLVNRDQLGKQYWLTGWCPRVTLHEMADSVVTACLSQKEKIYFLLFHPHLACHFPTHGSTPSFVPLPELSELFTKMIQLTNLANNYPVLA